MSDPLFMYVVYDHPKDYPENYVVRRGAVRDNGILFVDAIPTAVAQTLPEARDAIPFGLVRVDRDPDDDPVVVETWL